MGCPPFLLFATRPQPTGLLLQEETQSEHKSIHYLKLSTPWEVLVYYAEELCMRAPLQVSPGLFWCVFRSAVQELHFPPVPPHGSSFLPRLTPIQTEIVPTICFGSCASPTSWTRGCLTSPWTTTPVPSASPSSTGERGHKCAQMETRPGRRALRLPISWEG